MSAAGESRKNAVIEDILAAGCRPQIDIAQHRLPNEEAALRIEAALIDMLGLVVLTNEVHGWRRKYQGRASLYDLIGEYGRPLDIEDPAILIRINKLYKPDMSKRDLYEATRGIWKVGRRRSRARLAMAVFRGVVWEVYEIMEWHPAGTTPYEFRTFSMAECSGRWEFVGRLAPDGIREKYQLGNVSQHLSNKAQNPITYVCC